MRGQGKRLARSPSKPEITRVLLAAWQECLPNFPYTLSVMEQDIKRLGSYVEARRKNLGLSQADLAARGGPSDTTVSKIEMGRTRRILPKTARELDLALEWLPGSAESVMSGGEPGDAIAEPPPAIPGEEIDLRSTSIGRGSGDAMEFEIEGIAGDSTMKIVYRTGSRFRTVRTADLVDVFEAAYQRLLGVTYEVSTTADAWKVGPSPAPDRLVSSTSERTTVVHLPVRGDWDEQQRAARHDDVPKDEDF